MAKDGGPRWVGIATGAFIAAGFILPAAACIALTFGAWPDPDPAIDAKNVLRIVAGAIGTFVLACAAELFVHRRRISQVDEKTSLVEDRIQNLETKVHPTVDAVLRRRDQLTPWINALSGRRNLAMSGLSLRTFTTEYLNSVESVLASGGNCRFLLCAPRSDASAVVSRNILGKPNPAGYNREVSLSIGRLLDLQQRFGEAAIQVRTLDHVPASSITLLDPGRPDGKAFVELYTQEVASAGRPHLELSPSLSPVWYDYFVEQFDKLWAKGSRASQDDVAEAES